MVRSLLGDRLPAGVSGRREGLAHLCTRAKRPFRVCKSYYIRDCVQSVQVTPCGFLITKVLKPFTEIDKCPSVQDRKSLAGNTPVPGMCLTLNLTLERSRAQLAHPFSCVFKKCHPCLQGWKLTQVTHRYRVNTSGFTEGEHKFMCSYPVLEPLYRPSLPNAMTVPAVRIKVSQGHGALT